MIYNKRYFGKAVFPLPESIKFIEDYSLNLWALITGAKVGILPIFLRWYETGTGISSTINSKMKGSHAATYEWLMSLPEISQTTKDNLNNARKRRAILWSYAALPSRFHKLIEHPIIFLCSVFTRLSHILVRYIYIPFVFRKIEKVSGRVGKLE